MITATLSDRGNAFKHLTSSATLLFFCIYPTVATIVLVNKDVYIAGYICAKLNRRLSCQASLALYVASKQKHQNSTALYTALTKARNFDWAIYGLTVPMRTCLICAVEWIERAVQMNIEGVAANPCVMSCLKDIVCETVNVRSMLTHCEAKKLHYLGSPTLVGMP